MNDRSSDDVASQDPAPGASAPNAWGMTGAPPGIPGGHPPTQQAPWQQPPGQPSAQWQQQAPQQAWPPAVTQPYPTPSYPPQTYPGQQQPEQWPPTVPRALRSKKGLLIGAVAFAVVAAVGVTLAVVLSGDSSTSTVTTRRVDELATKPTLTWTVDLVEGDESEFIAPAHPVAVGDDRALVWPVFDYSSWDISQHETSGWYKDFDAHYDLGFAAGTAYAEAEDAADRAYEEGRSADNESPDIEDFWPAGFSAKWDDFDPDYAGFYSGFEDGAYGNDEGTSRVPAPQEVDFSPSLTLLDLTDGSEVWTIDLVSVDPEVDHSWYITAVSPDDGATIAVSMEPSWTGERDDRTTTIATLDGSDGSVVSTTTIDSSAWFHSIDGALLMVAENGDAHVISRLSPTALEADPQWETEVGDQTYPVDFAPGLVRMSAEDSDEVLSLVDGSTVWEGDLVLPLGSSALTLELDERSSTYSLDVTTAEGDGVWDAPLEVAMAWSVDGHVFTADSHEGLAYQTIQRIDPATGEDMWEEPAQDIVSILGVNKNSVVAAEHDRLVVLDLRTGEKTLSYQAKDFTFWGTAWIGTDYVYVSGGNGLKGLPLDEDGKQWTFEAPVGTSVYALGRHLVVLDAETGAISGLGAM